MRREPRNGQADGEVAAIASVHGAASDTTSADRVSGHGGHRNGRGAFDALGQFTSEGESETRQLDRSKGVVDPTSPFDFLPREPLHPTGERVSNQSGTNSTKNAGERHAHSREHLGSSATGSVPRVSAAPPVTRPADRFERALGLYETAMFSSDLDALTAGSALVAEILGEDPSQSDARLLRGRFETLRKMLEASPRADPALDPGASNATGTAAPAWPSAVSGPITQPGIWSRQGAVFTGLAGAVGIALLATTFLWRTGALPEDVNATNDAGATVESSDESSPAREDAAPPPSADGPELLAASPLIGELVLAGDDGRFPTAGAELALPSMIKLDALVGRARAQTADFAVEIDGHTDDTGEDAFNYQLGLERAETVRVYLHEKHALPLETMQIASYGETRPTASNDTGAGRAMNRRVVVRVLRPAPPTTAALSRQ